MWAMEDIAPTGTDGMWIATIGCPAHGGAITVIGASLTECCARALAICESMKQLDWATRGTA